MGLINCYYNLRPSLKRDELCTKFYFSNVNGLSGWQLAVKS